MDALLAATFLLACAVSVALMTLWMHKGRRDRGKGVPGLKVLVVLLAGAAALGGSVVGMIALRGEAAAPINDSGRFIGSEPPGRFALPSFALRDDSGALIRSTALRGRVTLLTFLDTQCTESCPIIARQIVSTIDLLGMSERKRVIAIAISTDPAEDTPASVQSFLVRHRAAGKLHYLVAPEESLRPLWKRFLILSSLESGKDSLHSAPVRIYSGEGVWLATQHVGVDLTPENLAKDIRTALENEG